jgi:hypothetical protein
MLGAELLTLHGAVVGLHALLTHLLAFKAAVLRLHSAVAPHLLALDTLLRPLAHHGEVLAAMAALHRKARPLHAGSLEAATVTAATCEGPRLETRASATTTGECLHARSAASAATGIGLGVATAALNVRGAVSAAAMAVTGLRYSRARNRQCGDTRSEE